MDTKRIIIIIGIVLGALTGMAGILIPKQVADLLAAILHAVVIYLGGN